MAPITFQFNVAFTLPVNNNDTDQVLLTASELWQGIKHGGRYPHDFAPYVVSCDVVSGTRKEFRRILTLADGAVHTAAGEKLIQDVVVADDLYVEGTTVDTGAKSTFLCSSGIGDGVGKDDKPEVYLTAIYELKLSNVQENTEEAREIERNYRLLAKEACRSAGEKIRGWKAEGKLEKWNEEDGLLDS